MPEAIDPASKPDYRGGHDIALLTGGDTLFPALHRAIDGAQHDIWLATYIFHDDVVAGTMAHALRRAAARGVSVAVVVDGFGSSRQLPTLRRWFDGSGVELAVFRPLGRWYAYLLPGQMRRLHQKLACIDGTVAFVGGINIVDDRVDVVHGATETPRLDFAVQLRGPVVRSIEKVVRVVWTRAVQGADWRREAMSLARGSKPMRQFRNLKARLRPDWPDATTSMLHQAPTLVALVTRDNLRQRSTIERAYIDAIDGAQQRIDLISPYFYPGYEFRHALMRAARRGVTVRVVLQGKVDYRIAAVAARALYDEMLANDIQIYEYVYAYLHAKVAVVDGRWSTVGSSNIDPMSLQLNLEANVLIDDEAFARTLAVAFEGALAQSLRVQAPPRRPGWQAAVQRGFVASVARWFLSLAGVSGRY